MAPLATLAAALATPHPAKAQTLPPPPYEAADQGSNRTAAASGQMDRYGGGVRHGALTKSPTAQTGSAAPASGPYLAWGGKVEAQAQPAAAPQGGWPSMSERWSADPRAVAAQMAPPQGEWRPYRPSRPAATTPAPAPTSIYDVPAQPALTPSTAAQPFKQAQALPAPNPQGGPRFYSVHREYGIQPDPIPLPPQFFGPTADLSTSIADPLAKRTTIVGGQTKTVNVPDDQGAQ